MRSGFRKLHVGDSLKDVLDGRGGGFPIFLGATTTNWRNTTTQPQIMIPNDCEVGDILIAILRITGGGSTWTWPAGWSELLDATTDGSPDTVSAAWHRVDGTETSGRVIPTYAGTADRLPAVALHFRNAGTPVASSVTAATTTTPNPPNLAPGLGTLNFAWVAVATMEDNRPTTPPANYTDGDGDIVNNIDESAPGGAGAATISWGIRLLNASSEDPGAFGAITNSFTMSFTLAVPPG